jgi:hypothetical protein
MAERIVIWYYEYFLPWLWLLFLIGFIVMSVAWRFGKVKIKFKDKDGDNAD